METSVVRSTYQGSSIAYLRWTDNVRAHADMNNHLRKNQTSRYNTHKRVLFMLIRSPQEWYNHTRDIYRCYVQDLDYEFARFGTSQTQRQVNAFNMSWTKFPPLPLCIALSLTPPYQERRGQPCLMPLKNSSKFSNIGHGYYSPLQKYIEIANTNKFAAIYFL